MLKVSRMCGVLTSTLFVLAEIDCSGGERHVHPAAAGDAQLRAAEAPGAHHLPHGGGREQRVWQGGRDADVVHRHQSHAGPSEGRQGASFSATRIFPQPVQASNLTHCPVSTRRSSSSLFDFKAPQ